MLIALIGCGAAKRAVVSSAIDLYIGPLFLAHRRYAEMRKAMPWILSAKHGLLARDQPVAPYDQTLTTASRQDRAAWDELVLRQMIRTFAPGTHVLVLAGSAYLGWCALNHGLRIEDPIGSLPIGRRLKKLKELMVQHA